MMNQEFHVIAFEEVAQYKNQREYAIIDLRSRQEYEKGHVEGARNIPNITNKDINRLSKSLTYILYCSRGSLSFKIGRIMAT